MIDQPDVELVEVTKRFGNFVAVASISFAIPSGGFFSPTDDPMHPHFAQDELDQIVRTAADLERPVMAHAHSPESIKRAVRAGVRSIEHGGFLTEEQAALMADRGCFLVPTLSAMRDCVRWAEEGALMDCLEMSSIKAVGR